MGLVGDPGRNGMLSLPAGIFQVAEEKLFGGGVTAVLLAIMLLIMKQRLLLLVDQLSASVAE